MTKNKTRKCDQPLPLTNRYMAVWLQDVVDGNPNGEPDNAGEPRVDEDTNQALMTDVCQKRALRDAVYQLKMDFATGKVQPGFDLLVKRRTVMQDQLAAALDEADANLDEGKSKDKKKKAVSPAKKQEEARKVLCDNYWDVRTFGGVLNVKEANCGQLTGPVQISMARSISEVTVKTMGITKCCPTKVKVDKSGKETETGRMGSKTNIPYALFRSEVFVSPFQSRDTGFSEDDLGVLFEAMQRCHDLNRTASKGIMTTRKLVIFKHSTPLGNAPDHTLMDLVKVEPKTDQPRSFDDYEVTVDLANVPKGVEVQVLG